MSVIGLKKEASWGGWKNRPLNSFVFNGLHGVLSELP